MADPLVKFQLTLNTESCLVTNENNKTSTTVFQLMHGNHLSMTILADQHSPRQT